MLYSGVADYSRCPCGLLSEQHANDDDPVYDGYVNIELRFLKTHAPMFSYFFATRHIHFIAVEKKTMTWGCANVTEFLVVSM
jgi:hypothetical protein